MHETSLLNVVEEEALCAKLLSKIKVLSVEVFTFHHGRPLGTLLLLFVKMVQQSLGELPSLVVTVHRSKGSSLMYTKSRLHTTPSRRSWDLNDVW